MFLGIDLGTSSLRAALVDEQGQLQGLGAAEYPILSQRPGFAEQDTESWWLALKLAVGQALRSARAMPEAVKAIGLSGQMHGTVLVGESGLPLARAIIWADQRSAAEAEELNNTLGFAMLSEVAGNRISPGFMAATLLWLRRHEPGMLEHARYALLPKDYLRLCLTGAAASEPSDASSTLLLDIRTRQWCAALACAVGLPIEKLPPLLPSHAEAGRLRSEAAETLGLRAGVPVVAGAADQAAQAMGNGILSRGIASCTIGTGGQFLQPSASPTPDPQLRVHCFCHALPDRWYVMAATLSAGLSLRWWRDVLGLPPEGAYELLSEEGAKAPPGAEGLLFLPYLLGERTPHMDPLASGALVGLTIRHTRGHIARAIMEGVTFSLREGAEVIEALTGRAPETVVASGGAAKSKLWLQLQADIFNRPITTVVGQERAVVGAAMLAAIGTGFFASFEEAARAWVQFGQRIQPEPQRAQFYADLYQRYRALYPLLRSELHALSAVRLMQW